MRFIRLCLTLLFIATALPAVAQALPNHLDPTAREVVPNLSALPAIRFLTTADFPPFNYRDGQGALIGFNIDLARAICDELEVGCTVQAWPWEQAANALADKQGDALIAGLALSPENGERFDFSNIYLALPGRFVTRREAAAGFSPEALDTETVSVRRGTTHAEFMRRYLPDATLAMFDTEIEALQAVADGAATAYFGDAMRASFWLGQQGDCCSFAGAPYFRSDLFGEGLAVAVPAGQDLVRQAVDFALARLKRNGRFDELYLRWFPVSFY